MILYLKLLTKCLAKEAVKKLQNDIDTTIEQLKAAVRKFVHDRAWEKYHNPKDVAEAICIEAAELLEVFQWASPDDTTSWKNMPSKLERVREELADVFIYCLSIANVMDIDITEAVASKIKQNEKKYPPKEYYGKARALS